MIPNAPSRQRHSNEYRVVLMGCVRMHNLDNMCAALELVAHVA